MDKRLKDILIRAEVDRQNALDRIAEIETAIQEQQAKLDRLSKIKMTLKQLLQFSEELDTLW